jgi:hypothetical protein
MSSNTSPPPSASPPPAPAPPPADRGASGDRDRPAASGGRPIGLGLVLIAAGALWLVSLAGVPIRWDLVLPIALVVVGALLLVGGRWTARGGLIGLGVVLAVVALIVSVAPPAPSISAGDRTYTVSEPADLDPTYTLGAGTLTLDLRELDLPPGATEVSVGVSMGELIVRVPEGVSVDGEASVVMGDVGAFGRSSSGITPRLDLAEPGDPDRELVLDLRVALGRIEVTR